MLWQRVGLVLAVLGIAAAAPAGADQPAAASDNAYWLVGSWLCHFRETDDSGTATFTRNDDGSIALKMRYAGKSGRIGEFDDAFRFAASKNSWTWTSTARGVPGFMETATAAPWTSQTWMFEGTRYATVIPQPVSVVGERKVRLENGFRPEQPLRMLFVHLNDASFERDFQEDVRGKWVTTSSSNCARLVTTG